MTYISFGFIIFFFILGVVYFALPDKIKWISLLVFSYVFYFLASEKLPLYMLVTTAVTYGCTAAIQKIFDKNRDYISEHKEELTREQKKALKAKGKNKAKAAMISAVAVNLIILCVFKYTDFIVTNAASALNTFGLNIKPRSFNLLLPLGISFYTFQSLGYIIDVFRQKYRSEKNFLKVALFVSYFPQIIEGPIGRFDHLAPQLFEGHRFSFDRAKSSIFLILAGFVKKLVIADNLAPLITDVVGNYGKYDGFQIITACMLYGIQLYCDFSGCMDIAMGFSNVLGIQLTPNFQRPYFSTSVADFWRRWHISLCSWFRDYLFYPISMSAFCRKISKKLKNKDRVKASANVPKYIAMAVVWSLTGLWHAACWTEILWGLSNGVIMIFSEQFKDIYVKINTKLKLSDESKLWNFIRIIRTYIVMTVLNFMCEFDRLGDFLSCTLNALRNPLPSSFSFGYLLPVIIESSGLIYIAVVFICCAVLLVHSVYDEHHEESLISVLCRKNWVVQAAVLIIAVLAVMIFQAEPTELTGGFMYAQF